MDRELTSHLTAEEALLELLNNPNKKAVMVTTHLDEGEVDVNYYTYLSDSSILDLDFDLYSDFPICLWTHQEIEELDDSFIYQD